jgi:uncharacterized membrane protein
MSAISELAQIGMYLLYISIPIMIFYVGYLIVTKAFKDMGFSSFETIAIVFLSFILGYGIIDNLVGINFRNIELFTYNNWIVGINTGGAIIPILLSTYLIIKKRVPLHIVGFSILVVTIITFVVTYPNPSKGIVSPFPFWLLPVFTASITSVYLLWKNFRQAAPLAYISGTIGVLIGADFLHLPELLSYSVEKATPAVIGGANIVDMIYITGVLAVIVDGILMYQQKFKAQRPL